MVLYKQSNRAYHDCMCCFNLRRAQNANLVFHQSGSDVICLYDYMSASTLDKVVTLAGEVVFERKAPISTKPEANSGERIDLRISGQL